MTKHAVAELGFKPGALRRHDAASVGHGHEVLDPGGEQGERARARKNLAEATTSMETMKNLSERLRLAATLLDRHPSVGKLMTFLEQETHTNVQLMSIVMRPEENRVLLEVITLDIPSLVGQLLHWTGATETVAGLTVTSVARQARPEFVGPVYSFDATLEFLPSFFHPFAPIPSTKTP